LSRGTGCGRNCPKWKPVVRQRCKGEMALCRSEVEEPWGGSDLTIVFQEAVSFGRDVQELFKFSPSFLFLLCGCISCSMAFLMSRSMYLVFAERCFVSCSLIIWSRLMLCSVDAAGFSVCASCMCLLCFLF